MKARRSRDGELAPTELTKPRRGVGGRRGQSPVLTSVLIKPNGKAGSQGLCDTLEVCVSNDTTSTSNSKGHLEAAMGPALQKRRPNSHCALSKNITAARKQTYG